MRKQKKYVAVALTLCLALSLFTSTALAAGTGYTDVPEDAPYAEAVTALSQANIMSGVGHGAFDPYGVVTRAQVVTTLGRLAKAEQSVTDDFTDVPADAYYSGYVGWAVSNGIVQGDGNGHFLPDEPITSTHLNLMLSRYADLIGADVNFYDTGAQTVIRADLAQRLYQFLLPDGIVEDTSITMPVRAHVTSTGKAGCSPDETAAEHAAHTSDGYVMGYTDRGIYTFMGIQYGTARRFENPKPANVYGRNGVANLYSTDIDHPTLAMVRAAASPQDKTNTVYVDYFGFAQFMTPSGLDMYGVESECLNLNIWTDSMDASAKKPVLVFMHGGGTNSDSANGLEVYDGHTMADYTDVVFVSVNARLGILGYSTDFTAIGGGDNLAARDMLLSLEWVKENIATFGGDPENVTILGQSGGGSKVSYLIDSKYADEHDLFQKAVAISASLGSSVTGTKAEREDAASALADAIIADPDNDVKDVSGVLPYLQSFRTDEISDVLGSNGYNYSGGFTVDGYIFDENSVFGDSETISDRAAQYTYLIGNTWSEMVGDDSIQVIQANDYNRAKALMSEEQQLTYVEQWRASHNMKGSVDELRIAFEKVFPDKDFYDICTLVSGNQGGFTRDNYYNSSMRVGNSGATVYEYLMAYEFPYFGGTAMYHTGDLAFWFYSLGNVRYQIAGDEENAYKVANFCANALANFCATGDPSVGDIKWLPHEDGNAHCMIVDVNSRLVDGDYGEELIDLMTSLPTE